jgi:hypothetical protein
VAEVHPAGQAMPMHARREVPEAKKAKPAPSGLVKPSRPAEANSDAIAPEMITDLQRLAGNRAVTALLQSSSDKASALQDGLLAADVGAHTVPGPHSAD